MQNINLRKDTNNNHFISFILSIIAIIVSLFQTFYMDYKNNQLSKELAMRQEQFELNLLQKEATPFLRLTKNKEPYATIKLFPPNRNLELIDIGGAYSSESYLVISDFQFENMVDNIAIINHIEYNNVAYELENQNLLIQKGETVSFSEDNKIIIWEFSFDFYIIVKTQYNEYFSYECTLNSQKRDGCNKYCTVENIGMPQPYDIDNDVYNNREVHLRDLALHPDNIIFEP